MATTAPETSVTFVCITSTGLQLSQYTFLTTRQLGMTPPSATPLHWQCLTMDRTLCGCWCTEAPAYNPGLLIQRKRL